LTWDRSLPFGHASSHASSRLMSLRGHSPNPLDWIRAVQADGNVDGNPSVRERSHAVFGGRSPRI